MFYMQPAWINANTAGYSLNMINPKVFRNGAGRQFSVFDTGDSYCMMSPCNGGYVVEECAYEDTENVINCLMQEQIMNGSPVSTWLADEWLEHCRYELGWNAS